MNCFKIIVLISSTIFMTFTADAQNTTPLNSKNAYFSSGCFWCVEAIFESVKGVKEVISGYSGGFTENPTYEQVYKNFTGHAETVKVIYNPNMVSFKTLVDVYFASQNPLQYNGQGPDHGMPYRSIIFFQNKEEQKASNDKKKALRKELGQSIAAEIKEFERFWEAESYHQDFEKRNPNHPYVKAVSIPRLERFKCMNGDLLK